MAKVLIVEDDEAVGSVISGWVDKMGHQALLCQDGVQALDVLTEHRDTALILTDIIMPGMDGREMIRQIRAQDDFRNVPILIISVTLSPEEIEQVLSQGAAAILPDPLKYDETRRLVEQFIREILKDD